VSNDNPRPTPDELAAEIRRRIATGDAAAVIAFLEANQDGMYPEDWVAISAEVAAAEPNIRTQIVAMAESRALDLDVDYPDEPPEDDSTGRPETMTPDEALAPLEDSAVEQGGGDPDADNAYAEALNAARDYAADVWGRTQSGIAPDLSGLEEFVPEGLSPSERQRFLNEAIGEGRTRAVEERSAEVQGATGASEDEARTIAEGSISSMDLGLSATPQWLLQHAQGELSDQQKRRYVNYWNDAYGTSFRSFAELVPVLSRFDGTEQEAQYIADAVLTDQEPLITHSIDLPLVQGRKRVSYTTEQMENLRTMGFSNDAITRLVRLAAITEGEDAIRPGDAGDTLRVGPLALLVRYYGGGEEFAAFNQSQQDIADIEQQLGLEPGEWGAMSAQERQAFRAGVKDQSYESPTMSVGTGLVDLVDQLESLTRAQGLKEDRGQLPGILAANSNFKRGLEAYRGDELLAFVHAVDPSLAQRVASTGGDPDKLGWEDNAAVFDIMERAGVVDDSTTGLRQLESATGFFGYFAQGRGSGGGGGAGPTRRVLDPESVKQQMQQLWSRMFLADVDDATVAAVTQNLQNQLDNAPEGMSFDVSARITAFLRGQDVYRELYSHKPEGLSEEEYQAQFAAGIADMIGNELNPEALKAGMRTGDYQAAVGRASAGEDLLKNSTLRGRWANAKQVLDRFS
jgi:hypothetical protein